MAKQKPTDRGLLRRGLKIAAVAVPAGVLIGWAIQAQSKKPLASEDIRIELGDVRSLAAEGRLLAVQARTDQLNETFYRTQTEAMRVKLDDLEQSHRSAVPSFEARQEYAAEGRLIGAVQQATVRLSASFADPDALRTVEQDLASTLRSIESLDHELKAPDKTTAAAR